MKPKKLIEVAMPIKEISAESVRDKYIHHGHISTLHIWWARRPLPLCRAAIFCSLVPDPLDQNTPKAFKESVEYLLSSEDFTKLAYKPYPDIPYTAIIDPMEDNLRNRLMMFVGKFSDLCQLDMISGKSSTSQKDLISNYSLIKSENKNNPDILRIARELIWVAYNADLNPDVPFEKLHQEFESAYNAIPEAEQNLYLIPNRHLGGERVERAEKVLNETISAFQSRMPSVFDPFAGGGAIPLEAARLGCRSYGNDINPVAHIIEKASVEFPQKYGKPIIYTMSEFIKLYGEDGIRLAEGKSIVLGETVEIPNRLAFDVEYFAHRLIALSSNEISKLYGSYQDGDHPVAYYWARTVKCSNPSCQCMIPMMKQFYLANKSAKKIYLNPILNGHAINFELKEGKCDIKGWNNKGNVTCPVCGSITSIKEVKAQSCKNGLQLRLLAEIFDKEGKVYKLPTSSITSKPYRVEGIDYVPMQRNSGGGDTFSWGIKNWLNLYTPRQLEVISCLSNNITKTLTPTDEYSKIITTYLAILVNRVCSYSTSFGRWIPQNEQITSLFGRQAIAMNSDFPELHVFSKTSSGIYNQLDWILRYIECESPLAFSAEFSNISSGDKNQFPDKSITAVVTDPPYYNAIAYADNSDFFYYWMKKSIGELYPYAFATPQTPKTEECTALKHHHNNDEQLAKSHFENKLTQIFCSIEQQTSDVVSIMFAHQSTEAWTTLCNSILSANMNITGSWAIDSERDTRMIANAGAALESSVTVACRPSQRKGFGEFKEVKRDIERKVKEEVDSLYELGFRGADLLTACFGQAVSEFGKYESVEKADGSEVSVAELLEMARQAAFDALLKGIKADDITRFYIGWLQLNGMGECDFDDATKFTRVGVNVEINDIISQRILIRTGNKVRLATAEEHISGHNQGFHADQPIIDQVHRAVTLFRNDLDKDILLKLIKECAPNATDSFWRVLASLKELMPANEDLKAVQGLLQVQETLRVECQKDHSVSQGSLFEFE